MTCINALSAFRLRTYHSISVSHKSIRDLLSNLSHGAVVQATSQPTRRWRARRRCGFRRLWCTLHSFSQNSIQYSEIRKQLRPYVALPFRQPCFGLSSHSEACLLLLWHPNDSRSLSYGPSTCSRPWPRDHIREPRFVCLRCMVHRRIRTLVERRYYSRLVA